MQVSSRRAYRPDRRRDLDAPMPSPTENAIGRRPGTEHQRHKRCPDLGVEYLPRGTPTALSPAFSGSLVVMGRSPADGSPGRAGMTGKVGAMDRGKKRSSPDAPYVADLSCAPLRCDGRDARDRRCDHVQSRRHAAGGACKRSNGVSAALTPYMSARYTAPAAWAGPAVRAWFFGRKLILNQFRFDFS